MRKIDHLWGKDLFILLRNLHFSVLNYFNFLFMYILYGKGKKMLVSQDDTSQIG